MPIHPSRLKTRAASPLPPSVNYHLWQPCNMRCRHCFATFDDVKSTILPKGHLPEQQAISLVALLCERFRKITFAGGEPTLCPWLPALVRRAHDLGAITMLVTNATVLDEQGDDWFDRFQGTLDWLTLSIDSHSPATNEQMGRAVSGRAVSAESYVRASDRARARGMRIKINSVVTRLNAGEDLSELLLRLAPERWKIFQALPVLGQNDAGFREIACSDEDFRRFVDRHAPLAARGIAVVPENNEAMRGSYAMVDPAGRFYDNVGGPHRYSRVILEVGIDEAWTDIEFSLLRFHERGGQYNFG